MAKFILSIDELYLLISNLLSFHASVFFLNVFIHFKFEVMLRKIVLHDCKFQIN